MASSIYCIKVIYRLITKELAIKFNKPSMYRHGLGTRRTESSSMSRIEDTINMEMFSDVD